MPAAYWGESFRDGQPTNVILNQHGEIFGRPRQKYLNLTKQIGKVIKEISCVQDVSYYSRYAIHTFSRAHIHYFPSDKHAGSLIDRWMNEIYSQCYISTQDTARLALSAIFPPNSFDVVSVGMRSSKEASQRNAGRKHLIKISPINADNVCLTK